MILKALYDYYQRCDNVAPEGMEFKEIGFLIVINKDGEFLRIEDCRIDKNCAKTFLVKRHIGKASAPVANYLYDNSAYVLGYSSKDNNKKDQLYFDTFREKIKSIQCQFPNDESVKAVSRFYEQTREDILEKIQKDPLWEEVTRCLSKKYSTFSFRIEGDSEIIAQKRSLLQLNSESEEEKEGTQVCLITGNRGNIVETTTSTMIPGSQATAKLVAFQVKSGYDSYGKSKGFNAPISKKAEFAYTTALNTMLARSSHNKFDIGERTFLFWASSNNDACKQTEESVFSLFGFQEQTDDDPNKNIMKVREVFDAIYSGQLQTTLDDRFYILGLAPNSARIAVVFWSETSIKDFAKMILKHFDDMEMVDTRQNKRPYYGLRDILGSITLGGKSSDATPNLPEALVKSIFQGLPYPYTLFSSDIRRIRAEQDATPYGNPCRVAIIKAYLNRLNDNNKKIQIMLDTANTNQGYLCGRLFAIIDKIQEDANHIHSIQERYMNSASATPAAVFATILNLSSHHSEKLNEGTKIYYEKIKQEIMSKLPANGFPSHLDLQDQGRFFVGFYHQRQDLFTSKKNSDITE